MGCSSHDTSSRLLQNEPLGQQSILGSSETAKLPIHVGNEMASSHSSDNAQESSSSGCPHGENFRTLHVGASRRNSPFDTLSLTDTDPIWATGKVFR